MSDFKIHTLGCGSAKPTLRHLPSCTVVEIKGRLMMIDCGEGAQLALTKLGLKPSRITDIFLTHLHGDHVLGMPGLISSLGLGERGSVLTIHTFEEGARMLREIFNFFSPELSFDLRFNIIRHEDALILDDEGLKVETVALSHRIPSVGFIISEKEGERHIIPERMEEYGIPISKYRDIKRGEDYVTEELTIPNSRLTTPPTLPRKYAHIGDTLYIPGLAERIGPTDLIYHETTYLEKDLEKAKTYFHSTARQAATVARDSGARALLTGHYSASIKDDEEILREAREVFPNAILNREGLITEIPQRHR